MKQLDSSSGTAPMHSSGVLAIIGFIVVACMLSTNNIVARAKAGEIPSFSLAFFRWTTVALGLTPFAVHEIKEKWSVISPRIGMVAVAGFCGMFLCGGPVYAAAVTTTAINIGLIMAAAPVNVFRCPLMAHSGHFATEFRCSTRLRTFSKVRAGRMRDAIVNVGDRLGCDRIR
jgi:hypothetical protein